ncbi:MAG: L7Ae/L30e/S12e/Gadd45 family ribosomal protein [Beduini sp.]|uniref:L7Ae/L30e/S12e/Gadd45 family ribosomal protein n=1 Tax=Beduini sp. TaxID=1922300 RepID=UPI0011C9B938
MLNKDVLNYIGLMMRSRNLASGEGVLLSIRDKSAKLVIIAEDASDNTKKRLIDKCTHYKIEYIIIGDSTELSNAIGKSNRMAIAVLDKKFAEKLKEKIG